MTLDQKLAAIFRAYISTDGAVAFGLTSLATAPRRVPQDGDTEAPQTRLDLAVMRDATGERSSTIKIEFHLVDPQDEIHREAAETQMDSLRRYIHHADLVGFINSLSAEFASGWCFASGIRDDAVAIDLMSDRLERRFSVAVSFDVANNPGG